MPQRLPIVNSDDGQWGTILNQYLSKEHYDDGTDNAANGGHKNITIRPGTAASGGAPLKFSSGTLLSSPEVGATEFAGDNLYFTITSGTVRKKVALYDDSAGATGDTYYRDSTGILQRLPIGATNQRLTVSGGVPAWRDQTLATSTKTSSYSVGSSDTVIFANASSASVVITLPAASAYAGYRFYVKRTDNSSNTCTISRSSTDLIDGQVSFTLDLQFMAVMVVSDGSAWYIL